MNLLTRLTPLQQGLICSFLLIPIVAHAQSTETPSVQQDQIRQQQEQWQRQQIEQQRQQQLQQQEQRSTQLNKLSEPKTPVTVAPSPKSENCFRIKEIQWNKTEVAIPRYLKYEVQAAILDDYKRPQCMNVEQLTQLQQSLNNGLIEHGYITSKISLPAQNIASGTLQIDWFPGTINRISHAPSLGKPIGNLSILGMQTMGALYNQRDADQALENLKRLGSQGNASIDLKPGETVGSSEMVYNIENQAFSKRLHGSIGIDNTGSDSTGLYQGNASITVDSPLNLNDQLTLNYNRNADAMAEEHSTKSSGFYWDVSMGYFSLNLGYTGSTYLRTEPGLNTPSVVTPDTALEGKSKDYSLGIGYMLFRDSDSKLQVNTKIGHKISRSYSNQTEIPIQFRDYMYTDSGLNYTRYNQAQQYSLSANVRQSLPHQSKALGEIYGHPEWDGQWRVYSLNATANIPFKFKERAFKYNTSVKLQHGERPLPSSEQISIGSRYSTRGFDDTISLSAEDGLIWRNELAYLYGANQAHQIYLGLDYGKIHGPAAQESAGSTLVGSALGVRGTWNRVGYDFALGMPVHKPTYSKTDSPAFYGSLNWSF